MIAIAVGFLLQPFVSQKWLLGDEGGRNLFVEVRSKLFDETNGVRAINIDLIFTAVRGKKTVNRITRHLGMTFGGPTSLSVGPFIGFEREQIFMSLTMGGVSSWLFDYDGMKLTTPYSRTSGRVATTIAPSGDGWEIDELWPKLQFEDEFRGQPERVRTDGWVLRRVPLIPETGGKKSLVKR